MKKSLVVLLALLAISGCTTLQYAGNASYTVEPFKDEQGAVHCCRIAIVDGKERAALDVHVNKTGDNYDITLSERNVAAFQGQAIAAGAAQGALDAAAKAAVGAALAPLLPALIPAAGAVITSGATGAVVGGAALGIAADKALVPTKPVSTPK